ncbi:MAG TPA: ATP synthase subunit I [Holophaga sp.]|nr:ATP synthase subunit I [Holophaga sp.]
MAPEDPGSAHLRRIQAFQIALLAPGALLWLLRSRGAALAFLGGGLASLAFWSLHRWVVGGMLTPSLRRRWLFAFLALAKLALIVLLLRGMMVCFPTEVLPFATGILLFSVSIVLEAVWLVLRPE